MTQNPLELLQQALADLAAADSALARLAAVRSIRAQAEQLEQSEVRAARDQGTSWSKIGSVYGLTKQGAQQRFGDVRRKKPEA